MTGNVVTLNHRGVTSTLLGGVLLAALASLAVDLCRFFWPFRGITILFQELSLNEENNVPTWYATVLLATTAGLLAITALLSGARRQAWGGLAVIFVLLSVDEAASLHERLIGPLQRALGVSGIFSYAWVIPALVMLVILTSVYGRFIVSLPPRARLGIVAAGSTYVSGAVGMELISGWYVSKHGNETLSFALLTTLEEVLEMLGVVLLIRVLLEQLSARTSVVIRLVPSADGDVQRLAPVSQDRVP